MNGINLSESNKLRIAYLNLKITKEQSIFR